MMKAGPSLTSVYPREGCKSIVKLFKHHTAYKAEKHS